MTSERICASKGPNGPAFRGLSAAYRPRPWGNALLSRTRGAGRPQGGTACHRRGAEAGAWAPGEVTRLGVSQA
jgi:hypothetical protein